MCSSYQVQEWLRAAVRSAVSSSGPCSPVVRSGCHPDAAFMVARLQRLWGVSLVLVLVLVGAGAAIWWRVSHAKWGLVRRVVFWVALVVVLWVW